MNLWPVEHFFPHFLTGHTANQSKSEEKSVQLFRGSFVPAEVTSYTIHILAECWTHLHCAENFLFHGKTTLTNPKSNHAY